LVFLVLANNKACSRDPQNLIIVLLLATLTVLIFSNTAFAQFNNPNCNGATHSFPRWEETWSSWTGNSGAFSPGYGSCAFSAMSSSCMSFTFNRYGNTQYNYIYQSTNLTGAYALTFDISKMQSVINQTMEVYIDSVKVGTYSSSDISVYPTFTQKIINLNLNYTGNHNVKFYNVMHEAGISNQDTLIDNVYLDYNVPAPVASFNSSGVSGGVPLEVTFNDTSSNNPTSWLWYTDDLSGGTDRNISHIYFNSGQFNVNLKATSSSGSDWENKTNYITVSPNTVIWYNLGDFGLYENANITNYLINHESNGIYIDYYVWENTTLGNFKHSYDLIFEDGLLHPYTTFTPEYPTANTANSSLFVRYMKDGVYHDYLAGSAYWNNGIYNNDTLNDSSIPDPESEPLPQPPEPSPITPPSVDPVPSPTPSPEPIPPAPVPPSPSNGSSSGNNSTGGIYPGDYAGNTSVNMSGLSGYYSYVDSAVSPLTNAVSGTVSFILSPVTGLTGYINSLNSTFSGVSGLANNSFLAEIVKPIFGFIPPELSRLILLSLILTIVLFLIRVR
jgi:PKD repeat protein